MKKRKIKFSINRTLLTEFLPYEIPFHFSNRHLYDFIQYNKIKLDIRTGELTSLTSSIDQTIFKLLFNDTSSDKNTRNICQAFKFKISNPSNIFRELSILHPRSQLYGIAFYDKYKETVLYNTTKESFSLRYPNKIAQYAFYKNKNFYNSLIEDKAIIETNDIQSDNVKSFFSYQRYSNISKFYDSEEFHKYEKEYDMLTKQDISKCFDSIYTHSLAWALYGKNFTKSHLGESKNNSTFHDDFDRLMSSMNFGETNGILIGSEFSRIFAEIIFQSIDRKIMTLLKQEYKLENDKHYKILRYVDDYFIFTNAKEDQDRILQVLQHSLSEFKLHLNLLKSETYNKPIITNISIAKIQITDLLDSILKFNLEKIEQIQPNDQSVKIEAEIKGNVYIDSKKLISHFKAILKTTQVEYTQVLNYTFSILQNKLETILKKYKKVTPQYRKESDLIAGLISLIEFSFFIYTVAPQVTNTTRLCRLLSEILFFIKTNSLLNDHKHYLYQEIHNNIKMILEKNQINLFSQIETINLLLISVDLGAQYTFTNDELYQYFNLNIDPSKLEEGLQRLNYFSYTALLFYIKNKKEYEYLKKRICSTVIKKIRTHNKHSSELQTNTEYTLLLFDLISCPYLDQVFKENLLRLYNSKLTPVQKNNVISYISNKKWFISWGKINFREELDKKIGLEVY